MIFVAGHSGAGKSTVLRLIAGITKPTTGKVLVNKHDLGELSDNQLCYMRQHIGIVFQDHKILFDRNVLQNVMLPLRIIGYDNASAEKRARVAIEKVGLAGRELSDPNGLSGGEQQRLCIARAVVHQPSPADCRRALRQPRPRLRARHHGIVQIVSPSGHHRNRVGAR